MATLVERVMPLSLRRPSCLAAAMSRSIRSPPTLLDEWRTRSIPIHVIYPPNRYLSAKVRVFIDWVVTLFERDELLRREPTHA